MYIETKTKFFAIRGKVEDGCLRFLSVFKAGDRENTITVSDVGILELLSTLECFLRGMLDTQETKNYKIVFLKQNNKKEAYLEIGGLVLSKLEVTVLKNILNLYLREYNIRFYSLSV